ncbi:MAG: YkgJ family cysteine cluster protein [Clostridia bacterium]|nr:YkgJ family cysteine cluster protein [Clostridia bacterium]
MSYPTPLSQLPISFDTPFSFHCTLCGACCQGREDLLLTPFDLSHLSRYLHKDHEQILQDYCIWYVDETIPVPLVALRMRRHDNACPFLLGRACTVQKAKPSVCALFPLECVGMQGGALRFLPPTTHCGAAAPLHTIRSYIKSGPRPDSEDCLRVWHLAIHQITHRMQKLQKQLLPDLFSQLQESLFDLLYIDYPEGCDMFSCFQENLREISDLLDLMEEPRELFPLFARAQSGFSD